MLSTNSLAHIFRVNERFTAREPEARDPCIGGLISGSYPSHIFITDPLKENACLLRSRDQTPRPSPHHRFEGNELVIQEQC